MSSGKELIMMSLASQAHRNSEGIDIAVITADH